MRRRSLIAIAALLFAFCSGLSTLTPEALDRAEAKWNATKPAFYRLVVSMEGDRVERSEYEVQVQNNAVTSVKRNGVFANPAYGQDYSIDGLFKILREEMELAKNPSLLGAPDGYSLYFMARFDDSTGRLRHYRRAVGGISNSIDIQVLRFEPQTGTGR